MSVTYSLYLNTVITIFLIREIKVHKECVDSKEKRVTKEILEMLEQRLVRSLYIVTIHNL